MTADDIKKAIESLAAVCQANGVRRIKTAEGIEIEFADPYKPMREADFAAMAKALEQGLPSDEETLMWSAPGIPVKPEGQEN